jgi:hypothetical protein
MSKKAKLLARLRSKPRDFTFDEAESLLGSCGYTMSNKGKTSGSRVKFEKDGKLFRMHKPHPKNILKQYQVVDLIQALEEEK